MKNLESNNLTFYHSPTDFALYGYDYNIYAVVKKCNADDDFSLVVRYTGNDNQTSAFMQPYHCVFAKEASFAIYYAVVPSSFLEKGKELKYEFFCNSKSAGAFSVPVIEAGEFPPLIITEIFARPKGLKTTAFVEFTNLSDEDIDLYDYKLMIRKGKTIDHNVPSKENYFTTESGKYIIGSGKTAAVFFCYPTNHNLGDDLHLTKQGFCKTFVAEDFRKDFSLPFSCDDLDIFPADITVYNEQTNSYELMPKAFLLPESHGVFTLSITPKDGGYEDSVFEAVINNVRFNPDNKVRRSAYFKADIKNPKKAVLITSDDFPTPGYFSDKQSLPSIEKAHPTMIIPVSPSVFYTAEGDYKMRFIALEVGEKADYANVFIKMPDKSYDKISAKLNENCEFEATIDKRVIAKFDELCYYISVNGSVYETTLGTPLEPLKVKLIDNAGPSVKLYPEKEEFLEADYKPTIYGEYFDISGVDTLRCELFVDNKNVTGKTKWYKNKFNYKVTNELKAGKHRIDLLVYDFKGNRTYIRRAFNISNCEDSDMNFYRGEIHSHTSNSDGSHFISDAMEYARDVGKVDFFSVTNHSHYLNNKNYQNEIDIADSFYQPGVFVSLFGYEMTWNNSNGYFGHINVVGTDRLEQDIDNVDIESFYKRLKKDKNAVAMFNHPGLEWGNFDEYALHDAEIDDKVCLSEIKGAKYDNEYMLSLSKGWHVSPMFNEDNHRNTWTTEVPSTSVAIAPSLTRANIMQAFRKRRTYSTSDPTMKIMYKINGEWMGSRLDNPEQLNVAINITTENINGIGKISIIAEDNITVMTFDAASLQNFDAELVLPAIYDYYYLKITSQGQYTVTAPVWIENRKPLRIQNLSVGLSNDADKPHSLSFSVTNNSINKAKNIMADIYLTMPDGFDINTAIPLESIYIDKLEPNQSYNIIRRIPDNKYHRITVIINGLCKKLECGDTEFVLISPVSISEIMPITSDKDNFTDVKNPFPYIKIHNNTNKDLSLDGMQLRLWTVTGKKPQPSRIQSLDGMTIAPSEEIVVWVKCQSELTISDFNKFHGTNYVEGKDLYIITNGLVSNSTSGRMLDIYQNNQIISRVTYNYGVNKDKFKAVENKALFYEYLPDITTTSYPVSQKPKVQCEKLISSYTREKTLKKEISKTKKAKSKKLVSISSENKNKIIGAVSTLATGAIFVAAALIKGNKKKNNIESQKQKKK